MSEGRCNRSCVETSWHQRWNWTWGIQRWNWHLDSMSTQEHCRHIWSLLLQQ